jgi:hypothetical protein
VPAEVLAMAEAKLVELAADHGPKELARLAEKILEVVAPELFEDHDRRLLEKAERDADRATRLTLKKRGDGSTDLRARIPDAVATRLKTYLDAFTSPRHQAMTNTHATTDDGADDGTGCAVPPPEPMLDPATGKRLPAERVRGVAFCSLLEAIDPDRLPQHGGQATTLVVTMPLADLQKGVGVGTLPDGTTLSPGQFRRLACTADLVPAVLGGDSEVLDLGRTDRYFTGKQRLAKAIENPYCRAEGCTVPATWSEGHHKRPWANGGRTDYDDLVPLCGWHHHRAHDEHYTVEYLPNGDVRFHRRR